MLGLAGGAPGRPDVDQGWAAKQIVPDDQRSVASGKALRLKVREGLADQRGRQSVRVLQLKADVAEQQDNRKDGQGRKQGRPHQADTLTPVSWPAATGCTADECVRSRR